MPWGRLTKLVVSTAMEWPSIVALALFAVNTSIVIMIQRKVLQYSLNNPYYGVSLPETVLLIFFNNLLAGIVYYMAFTTIYRIALPVSYARCARMWTPDCKLTLLMKRAPLPIAIIIFTVITIGVTINSGRLFGAEGLGEIAGRVAYSIVNAYGLLELSGYLALALSPLASRGASLALGGVTLILLGALIEAWIIVGG
ncbi:MAG: hypothetical protein F7B17_08395 [Desulfurococcales archaeon]|nr:hypothetical protein [Desulfurococcales archaeon]